jgi:hypothetical protein
VEGSCEHCNEPSGYIKGGDFLNRLGAHQLNPSRALTIFVPKLRNAKKRITKQVVMRCNNFKYTCLCVLNINIVYNYLSLDPKFGSARANFRKQNQFPKCSHKSCLLIF